MIRLEHVAKSLGGRALLHDVCLRVAAGETVCLHGASGAGKTTLLEVAAKVARPDAGAVVHGSARQGCVFQDDVLVPWLTALENVALVLPLPKPEREDRARYWLARLKLPPDMLPTRMSGGMRRRLSLARALAAGPDLLFLDEPFAFLDEEWQELVAQLVEECRESGCAVLMASHQLRKLDAMACRVLPWNTLDRVQGLDTALRGRQRTACNR